MIQNATMLIADSPQAKSAECALRDRIVASITRATPVNDAARERLQSFSRNLEGVDSAMWMKLMHIDRARGGLVEKGVISHLERIAANSSHYTDARAMFAAFVSMKAAA
jgi:hypothetical protein